MLQEDLQQSNVFESVGSIEDNSKKLQRRDLTKKDRLATRLIISEQKILQGTVDAVRR